MSCFNFYKGGSCTRDPCLWLHVSPDEVAAQCLAEPPSSFGTSTGDATPAVALPCVEIFDISDSDDTSKEDFKTAVTCVEYDAVMIDDSDDRLGFWTAACGTRNGHFTEHLIAP